MKLDTSGNLHSEKDGRFTGHVRTEADGSVLQSDLPALFCHECGGEVVIESDGVSHHLTPGGEVDFETDADHVAIDESLMVEATVQTSRAAAA